MEKPKSSKKNPKVLRTIKSVEHYEKKLGKAKRKKDPIAHAHKESSKSPKSMYKESMKHLHSLLDKKK